MAQHQHAGLLDGSTDIHYQPEKRIEVHACTGICSDMTMDNNADPAHVPSITRPSSLPDSGTPGVFMACLFQANKLGIAVYESLSAEVLHTHTCSISTLHVGNSLPGSHDIAMLSSSSSASRSLAI